MAGVPNTRANSTVKWYLEHHLLNGTFEMEAQNGSHPSVFVAGDVIEPYWVDHHDSRDENAYAHNSLNLFCLSCDNALKSVPWQACNNFTTNVSEVTQAFSVSVSSSRYQITVPDPDIPVEIGPLHTTEYVPIYACALQRESSVSTQSKDMDRQGFGEIFFVLGLSANNPLIYNLTYADGTPIDPDDKKESVPAFVFPPTGKLSSSGTYGSFSKPSSYLLSDALPRSESLKEDESKSLFNMSMEIRADDLLEPRWIEDPRQPVTSLGLSCLACPNSGSYPSQDDPVKLCNTFRGSSVKEFYKPIHFSSPGGEGLSVRMPFSQPTYTISACAFHLNYSTATGGKGVITSRVFFVSDSNIGREEQFLFNITNVEGSSTGTRREDLSHDDESLAIYRKPGSKSKDGLSSGATASIVIACIVGLVAIWLLWRCYNRKVTRKGAQDQAGLSRAERGTSSHRVGEAYAAPRLRSEAASSTPTRHNRTRPRHDQIEMSSREGAGATGEQAIAKPPPAYHEVVTDQERMLAQYEIAHNSQPPPDFTPRAS
jgi:hypothetical protein